MQNVVLAAKIDQALCGNADEITKYTRSQTYILPLKCRRVQRF